MSTVIPIEHRRLKYVAQLNMGQSPLSEDVTRFDEGEGLPFLQGNAEFGTVSPTPKHTCNTPPKTAKVGDLLVSVRAPVGALNIADQMYGIGRGLCAVTWKNVEPRFGWWAMHFHRGKLSEVATGSTYEAVSAGDLGNLFLALPDIETQRLIADYLDREIARIDALVAEKEKMLALLEEKRAALISRAVTRGLDPNAPLKPSGLDWLGDIPAHWEVIQVRFACPSLQTGPFGSQLHAEEYIDNGIPVINPAHLKDNKITPDYGISVDDETANRLSTHKLREGDVVFGRRGELGRCGVVDASQIGWLCGTGSLRVRCDQNKIDPNYLALIFNGTNASKRLTVESVGSTMDNLNTETLGHFRIPYPPLPEQNTIVSYIKSMQTKTLDLMGRLQKSIRVAKERRSALITAAVTGQISIEEMSP